MNIDGAFAAEKNSGAMGAVARDVAGDFLMAMIRRLLAVASTLAAEAEARLRAGVQLIHSVTQGAVILETDSLELVGLWNNKETQRSEFTPIFSDIQEMSSGFSTSFNVLHARRSANKAAHVCASFAEHSAFDVWANAPPSFLLQVLQDDCNHVDD